jgi:hypothetical protein
MNEQKIENYFKSGISCSLELKTYHYLGVSMNRIDILGVGTTEEPFTVRKHASGAR